MRFEWIPTDQQKTFQLDPSVAKATSTGKADAYILIASFNRQAQVRRAKAPCSRDSLRKAALNLADETGNQTIIAEDHGGTFKAIGRVSFEKADPLSNAALDNWSNRLSNQLTLLAEGESIRMATLGLDALAFDWGAASSTAWFAAEQQLAGIFANPSLEFLGAQRIALSDSVYGATTRVGGAMARQPGINIGVGLRVPADQAARGLSRHHSFFVRDQYGRISPSLSAQARPFIERGLSQGLGRETIAKDLAAGMRDGLRMRGYWETVASNAMTQSRTFGSISSLSNAGIKWMQFEAILDDRTTEICSALHGGVFPVDRAMAQQNRMMNAPTPEEFIESSPMTYVVTDSDGTERVVVGRGSEQRTVMTITSPSPGGGAPGTYEGLAPPGQLVDEGLAQPGLHHRCRSTLVAVFT